MHVASASKPSTILLAVQNVEAKDRSWVSGIHKMKERQKRTFDDAVFLKQVKLTRRGSALMLVRAHTPRQTYHEVLVEREAIATSLLAVCVEHAPFSDEETYNTISLMHKNFANGLRPFSSSFVST